MIWYILYISGYAGYYDEPKKILRMFVIENDMVPIVYFRIRWLLRRAKEDFENVCYLVNEEEDCEPTYVNMPWTEIIAACVQHQITNIDLKHRHQVEPLTR